MFTGLIQTLGTLSRLERRGPEATLSIQCDYKNYVIGESIAVMGACLTVTAFGEGSFTAFASAETLERTGLGALGSGTTVNLERALKAGESFGGHIVSGHIDARVTVLGRERVGLAERFAFALPGGPLDAQIAQKGSVAIDGVSLTVNDVSRDRFEVMIIPHTLGQTTLGALRPGSAVNLETDVLAKYVARQLGRGASSGGVDIELLERAGFTR